MGFAIVQYITPLILKVFLSIWYLWDNVTHLVFSLYQAKTFVKKKVSLPETNKQKSLSYEQHPNLQILVFSRIIIGQL